MITNIDQRKFSLSEKSIDIILEEYKTLRQEILIRLDQQNRLSHYAVVLFSIFLTVTALIINSGINTQKENLGLIISILLLSAIPFIMLVWAYQETNFFVSRIGQYINKFLVPLVNINSNKVKMLMWEDFLARRRNFDHDILTGSRFLFLNIFVFIPMLLSLYIIYRYDQEYNIYNWVIISFDIMLMSIPLYIRHKTVMEFKKNAG